MLLVQSISCLLLHLIQSSGSQPHWSSFPLKCIGIANDKNYSAVSLSLLVIFVLFTFQLFPAVCFHLQIDCFSSLCFNKKKTLQWLIDTFSITWYIPKPFVESNLAEGWFTITKEKPYRDGRSKRLLACDLSLQKN